MNGIKRARLIALGYIILILIFFLAALLFGSMLASENLISFGIFSFEFIIFLWLLAESILLLFKKTNMSWKDFFAGLGFLLTACSLPLLMAALAELIGEHLIGCNINEGVPDICLTNGVDFGNALYGMFVLHWAVFVTMPIFLLIFGCSIIIQGTFKIARMRSKGGTNA